MDKIEELKGSNLRANKSSVENFDDSFLDTNRESSRIPFRIEFEVPGKDEDILIIDGS